MTVLLLQTLEQLIHKIDDHREGEIEGDVENFCYPRDCEESEKADHKTDNGVTNRMHRLFDLLFITGREDKGDTTEDDVDKTKDGSDHQTKSNESCQNLKNRTIFDEVAEHRWCGKSIMPRQLPARSLSSLRADWQFRQSYGEAFESI